MAENSKRKLPSKNSMQISQCSSIFFKDERLQVFFLKKSTVSVGGLQYCTLNNVADVQEAAVFEKVGKFN